MIDKLAASGETRHRLVIERQASADGKMFVYLVAKFII